MSQVSFFHTSKFGAVKQKLAPAATIALKRDGNDFVYGVTICSKYDNFSKKEGRERALARAEQEFRRTRIPESLLSHEGKELTANQVDRIFLVQLGQSVTKQHKKWKKKITKFNLGAKVVPMTPEIGRAHV